jgi:DNA-binding transcriptional LysR family regulator
MFPIHRMNLASIDLNLLVALDALISEAHVGRAARKIGLSQPAASHALKRLRDLLSDPLLVRVGSRMELTPRAIALRESLAETLQRVQTFLVADSFDPARSSRRFAIMMQDHVAHLIVSRAGQSRAFRRARRAPGCAAVAESRLREPPAPPFHRSTDLLLHQ